MLLLAKKGLQWLFLSAIAFSIGFASYFFRGLGLGHPLLYRYHAGRNLHWNPRYSQAHQLN